MSEFCNNANLFLEYIFFMLLENARNFDENLKHFSVCLVFHTWKLRYYIKIHKILTLKLPLNYFTNFELVKNTFRSEISLY